MILSFAPLTPYTLALWTACSVAALAYGAAALFPVAPAPQTRAVRLVLLLAWGAQALALLVDIAGIGHSAPGARFGFAPALSMTLWLVLGVYMVESSFFPLPSVRRVLSVLGLAVVVLAGVFPGENHPLAASPWAPVHWVLGLASYGLFGVAVLHAALLNSAERRLRLKKVAAPGAMGLPLLRLERLTFQFVAAGVIVLSLAIALGWWFTPHWRWDHKNLLSVLGWLVLTGLLAGRQTFGWRGRRATRWLYLGAGLLLLAYVGSRFVVEVLLQRVNG